MRQMTQFVRSEIRSFSCIFFRVDLSKRKGRSRRRKDAEGNTWIGHVLFKMFFFQSQKRGTKEKNRIELDLTHWDYKLDLWALKSLWSRLVQVLLCAYLTHFKFIWSYINWILIYHSTILPLTLYDSQFWWEYNSCLNYIYIISSRFELPDFRSIT